MLTKSKSAPKASKAKAYWARREESVAKGSAAYTSVVIDKAANATVWDLDGKAYVDFAGGIGALNVGHCHPRVVAALREQAGRLLHTSFHVAAYPGYVEVCRKLREAAPIPGKTKALLFNSGSEAVENAVKFARAFTKRRGIVSFDNAFHGRTLLCLTLDGKVKPLRQGFGPAPAEIYRARYPNPYRPPAAVKPEAVVEHALADLERLFQNDCPPEDVAAIILEPVQGEGGFVVPPAAFLPALRALCDRHGILLIVDEVQTGFGRTGELFAVEHAKVAPDLLVVAKSLAAGMPLSGVVGRAEVMDAAAVGAVGGTYGGNPMSCAAALAVFEIIESEGLVERARRIGKAVAARFDAFKDEFPFVGDSRGLGAMRAIELVKDKRTKEPLPVAKVKELLHACEDAGLIAIKAGAHDNVIRTLMPLTIGEDDLARGLDILHKALKELRL